MDGSIKYYITVTPICREHFPVLSTFTGFVTRLTRRVQELLTLTGAPECILGFSEVRITRSKVVYACSVYPCLSFLVNASSPSLIYELWLSLCYLQTLLPIRY